MEFTTLTMSNKKLHGLKHRLEKVGLQLDSFLTDGPDGSFKDILMQAERLMGELNGELWDIRVSLKRILEEEIHPNMVEVEMRYAFSDEDEEEATNDFFGNRLDIVEQEAGGLIFKVSISESQVPLMFLMMQMLAGLDMPMQTHLDMGMFVDGERYNGPS